MAHGLDLAVGLDRPVVDATGQLSQLPAVGAAERRLQDRPAGLRPAHRRSSPPGGEDARRSPAPPPTALDRQGVQERQLLTGSITTTTPARLPPRSGRRVGLAASEASLARNFTDATPTEHIRPSSVATRARIAAAMSGPGPNSRSDPVTSRKASSSEIPSTSGV